MKITVTVTDYFGRHKDTIETDDIVAIVPQNGGTVIGVRGRGVFNCNESISEITDMLIKQGGAMEEKEGEGNG